MIDKLEALIESGEIHGASFGRCTMALSPGRYATLTDPVGDPIITREGATSDEALAAVLEAHAATKKPKVLPGMKA